MNISVQVLIILYEQSNLIIYSLWLEYVMVKELRKTINAFVIYQGREMYNISVMYRKQTASSLCLSHANMYILENNFIL